MKVKGQLGDRGLYIMTQTWLLTLFYSMKSNPDCFFTHWGNFHECDSDFLHLLCCHYRNVSPWTDFIVFWGVRSRSFPSAALKTWPPSCSPELRCVKPSPITAYFIYGIYGTLWKARRDGKRWHTDTESHLCDYCWLHPNGEGCYEQHGKVK